MGVRRFRRPQRLHLPKGLCRPLPGEPLERGRRVAGQERLRLRGRAHRGAREPIQRMIFFPSRYKIIPVNNGSDSSHVATSVVVIPCFGGFGFGIGIPTDELELELLELGPLLEPAPLLELVPHLELVPLPELVPQEMASLCEISL